VSDLDGQSTSLCANIEALKLSTQHTSSLHSHNTSQTNAVLFRTCRRTVHISNHSSEVWHGACSSNPRRGWQERLSRLVFTAANTTAANHISLSCAIAALKVLWISTCYNVHDSFTSYGHSLLYVFLAYLNISLLQTRLLLSSVQLPLQSDKHPNPNRRVSDLHENVPHSRLREFLAFFSKWSEMFSEGSTFDQLHDDIQLVLWRPHTRTHTINISKSPFLSTALMSPRIFRPSTIRPYRKTGCRCYDN